MKKLLLLFAGASLIASCSKTTEQGPTGPTNPAGATDLGELTIPTAFNWSSSQKGSLNVSIDAPQALDANGNFLYLVDDNDNILDRSVITNGSAEFYYNVPQNGTDVSLFHAETETYMAINSGGNVTFKIEEIDIAERFAAGDADESGKKGTAVAVSKGKTAANQIVNPGFSIDDIGFDNSSSYARRTEGKWYQYDNDGDINVVSGDSVYQSESNSKWTCIMQSVAISPGSSYTFSAIYGTTGSGSTKKSFYLDFFDANDNWIGYHTPSTSGGNASKSGTAPSNAAYMQVYVSLKKWAWVDNVNLDVTPAVQDSDNDGVPDDTDDYPNDPSRAYTSNFPTSGYQTVSFEDLWPAKGDYDFNDMVINNQVVYSSDANNDKVDAQFTISLDAVGSGFSNGLAIVFVDGNKQAISADMIASVSGDAIKDPNVTNGIVVFDDVYAAQSQYYQNNGVGPDATADVFTFTVTFNNNVHGQTIIPDVYIYRTNDRGLEVHLDGFSGTTAANTAYYNTIDDVNGTYSTSSGLPWVLEVVTQTQTYKHPLEKVDILVAYPSFQSWAESSGSQNTDWMDNPVLNEVYQ